MEHFILISEANIKSLEYKVPTWTKNLAAMTLRLSSPTSPIPSRQKNISIKSYKHRLNDAKQQETAYRTHTARMKRSPPTRKRRNSRTNSYQEADSRLKSEN